MKNLTMLSWLAFAAAVLLMIAGLIDFLNGGGFWGLRHSSTFFTVANTALLVGVFLRLLVPGEKA